MSPDLKMAVSIEYDPICIFGELVGVTKEIAKRKKIIPGNRIFNFLFIPVNYLSLEVCLRRWKNNFPKNYFLNRTV